LDEVKSPKLEKILEEGQTKLYVNKNSMERAFFVRRVIFAKDDINTLFNANVRDVAIVSSTDEFSNNELSVGQAVIQEYKENEVKIVTENNGNGFLVISDVYYPSWHVFIDGKESRIVQTDHALRGIYVPSGRHIIIFKASLF
jgi:uncharacterized membrane protein YfhO